eukprot:Clim_evm37s143 gene=Clim_evmTU37s143
MTVNDESHGAAGEDTMIRTAATKLRGYDFYRQVLKSPKRLVAPMVDQSELPWRMLSRKYNADLCYTPMFHAALFGQHASYRKENFQTCPEDRPLVVQFCANDPNELLKAAKYVENDCDAVDINLGCPQGIARKGHYGAFLQDEWELVASMVRILDKELKVPVTCKIRVFDTVEKTVAYAKMIEAAGCSLLTVHGRTREQKGQLTGLADWDKIKAVKEAVKIPVIANGNIVEFENVDQCIQQTGVEGVMIAEANLANPAFFAETHPHICDIADEYLDLVEKYPIHRGSMKAHLFYLWKRALYFHPEFRDRVGTAHDVPSMQAVSRDLRSALDADEKRFADKGMECPLDPPYWQCYSFIRTLFKERVAAIQEKLGVKSDKSVKMSTGEAMMQLVASVTDSSVDEILAEKRRQRELKRKRRQETIEMRKERKAKFAGMSCPVCNANAVSHKCNQLVCKTCCIKRCKAEDIWCEHHRVNLQLRHQQILEKDS